MQYFQVLYPNYTTAIVTPCFASDYDRVLTLLSLIQSRDIDDPFAQDLMAKLAAIMPRADVNEVGFKLYCITDQGKEYLKREAMQAIFYGDDCLMLQIHKPREDAKKKDNPLPLKLTPNVTANLLAQLLIMSRESGCNTIELMDRYSLADITDMAIDFNEMMKPKEDREEEKIAELWEEHHAANFADPKYLLQLNSGVFPERPQQKHQGT